MPKRDVKRCGGVVSPSGVEGAALFPGNEQVLDPACGLRPGRSTDIETHVGISVLSEPEKLSQA